ncbi:MAG: class I SAM-dependent methyltransferase [candidate division Zixibacteria bacterium]|nr:class I SAM-dependent methyltransferase [candidate division Zixibacteria bacterium]
MEHLPQVDDRSHLARPERRLAWARGVLARRQPDYRFRWEIYFDRLGELARSASSFLDAGCGDNKTASQLSGPRLSIGVDISPHPVDGLAVSARLEQLPFRDGAFDLVGCRYVVEHLEHPISVFTELQRVMRPQGRLLIQTVNRQSPLIMISRLLGNRMRQFVVRRRYGRNPSDIFLLFDRFNTPVLLENPPAAFRLISVRYTQDVDVESRLGFWLTYLLLLWAKRHPQRSSTLTVEWERV